MKILNQVTFSTMLVGILLAGQTVGATSYYVAPTGSDTSPGTQTQPFRTIPRGTSVARAGDTVYVMNGTYSEPFRMIHSGQPGLPITLANYPGHSPIISFASRTNPANQIVLASTVSYTAPIGWITIEGFEVTNGYAGINLTNAHNVTIRRMVVHDMYMGAVGGNGTQLTIDRNRFYHNGRFEVCAVNRAVCNQDQAIYIWGTSVNVTNNLIYNNLSYGIQVAGYPFDSSKHTAPEYAGARNWVIANNTIAYQQWRSAIVVWQIDATDNLIENNVFYENSQLLSSTESQGIEFYYSGINNIVRNNIFHASGAGGTGDIADTRAGSSYTQSANKFQMDPKFKNPAAYDFRLLDGSPAIDAGVTEPLVPMDFGGTLRPQGSAHDIGAYEGTGLQSDTTAPDAPRNVSIF